MRREAYYKFRWTWQLIKWLQNGRDEAGTCISSAFLSSLSSSGNFMFTFAYILAQLHPHSFKKFPFLCIWNSTDSFFADFLRDGRNGFYKLGLILAHFFSVPLRFTSNTVSLDKVCISNLCKLTSVWGAPWRLKAYFPRFSLYFRLRLPFSRIYKLSVINGLVFVMK
jgi:hypothetical protein